ncbi:polysaccharide deacetylase family protein [Mucilaginibacter sp. CSA2-8R]|uniref:polysaccharide deacetylase family protein n=1 Tax=Mucilaginibacter sp. CSA2-8R TaxID=3141542 RepID=UPI00315DB45F
MKKVQGHFLLSLLLIISSIACQQATQNQQKAAGTETSTVETTTANGGTKKTNDVATMMARKEIPILCYHQIREWTARDSKRAKDNICSVGRFKSHVKMLADSGYHSILPDQLYAYLTQGTALPPKPILITFDDTDLHQYTVAYPELKKYNFKALYFIMTVSFGLRRYMSKRQVKTLADEGNIIGSHTYDHKMVVKYQHNPDPKLDWTVQVDNPTKTLENLTGKKVEYFAYPYGLWSTAILPEFQKHHFKAAFQLAEKRDPQNPLYTIRRIIGSGYWSAGNLNHAIKKSFK